jgi:hypothetical protein
MECRLLQDEQDQLTLVHTLAQVGPPRALPSRLHILLLLLLLLLDSGGQQVAQGLRLPNWIVLGCKERSGCRRVSR